MAGLEGPAPPKGGSTGLAAGGDSTLDLVRSDGQETY